MRICFRCSSNACFCSCSSLTFAAYACSLLTSEAIEPGTDTTPPISKNGIDRTSPINRMGKGVLGEVSYPCVSFCSKTARSYRYCLLVILAVDLYLYFYYIVLPFFTIDFFFDNILLFNVFDLYFMY